MTKIVRRKDPNGRVLPDGVTYREKEGRYLYRYSLYGKPHYIYDKDLNKLKEKIEKQKIDVAVGKNIDFLKMSLNEWYPQYLEIFKKDKVKAGTMCNLKNYYKWYIEDYTIGHIPLGELKRTQIVAHFRYLAKEKGLAQGTLRSLASMLYNCLQQALYDGVMFVNPASEIMKDVVATPPEVREALTHEEVDRLLDFLKEDGFQHVYLPMIGVLLGTGLRFGECDGLTWSDVDLEKKVLHVTHTLNYRNRGRKEGHEFFITTPKTPNAIRDIPLTEDVCKLFEMQKKYQKQMRIRNDIEIDGYSNFIFTTKLGFPFTHEGFVASLRRIIKHANETEIEAAKEENREPVILPDFTPHHLRHTFCTRLVENEVPYEVMKAVLGHKKISTSIDIYTSISNNILKRVKRDIEGVVKIF